MDAHGDVHYRNRSYEKATSTAEEIPRYREKVTEEGWEHRQGKINKGRSDWSSPMKPNFPLPGSRPVGSEGSRRRVGEDGEYEYEAPPQWQDHKNFTGHPEHPDFEKTGAWSQFGGTPRHVPDHGPDGEERKTSVRSNIGVSIHPQDYKHKRSGRRHQDADGNFTYTAPTKEDIKAKEWGNAYYDPNVYDRSVRNTQYGPLRFMPNGSDSIRLGGRPHSHTEADRRRSLPKLFKLPAKGKVLQAVPELPLLESRAKQTIKNIKDAVDEPLPLSLSELGKKGDMLSKWLISRAPDGFRWPSVAVERYGQMGLGLCSTTDIEEGEEVMCIPDSLWAPVSLTRAREVAEKRAPKFTAGLQQLSRDWSSGGNEESTWDSGSGRLEPTVLLALHAVMELRTVPANLDLAPGQGSHPYFAFVASTPPPDTPAWWPEDRLDALRGSRTLAAARTQRAFATQAHQAVFRDNGIVSLPEFEWALRTILSRAMSGMGPYTFVPVLDFLNHSKKPSVEHSYNESDRCWYVYALRDIPRGEQLLTSYGTRGNDELLRLYGFTLAGNPYTSAEIRPSAAGGQSVRVSVMAADRAAGMLLWQAGDAADPVAAVEKRIAAALHVYRTTEESDRAELSSLPPDAPSWRRDVLQTLVQEKAALRTVWEVLDRHRAETAKPAPDTASQATVI